MSKYIIPLRFLARRFHCARNYNGIFKYHKEVEEGQKAIVVRQQEMFDELAKKANDKKTFHEAIDKYLDHQAVHRRGHVEFISAALERMQEFGVERDLTTYKKLLHLFPKGKMIPETIWQVEFLHYPKQQYCAMDLLTQMQENGICPDDEVGDILAAIFGKKTHTFRKYQRMLYWMPKFKYASPYYVPFDLPESHIDLATMALQRMCPDLENKVTIFQTEELENVKEHTFIASAISPAQQKFIENHPTDKPIVVEGGFTTWLRTKSVVYFVLRGQVTDNYRKYTSQPEEKPTEEMFDWKLDEEPSDIVLPPSVHEQADGTVLAMAVTGSASKDSLVYWIKFLERTNPKLAQVPIVFLLQTPETGLEVVTDSRRPTKLLSQ